MKKILALVLALTLCLTMTAAMAEAVNSKTTANLVYTNSTEVVVATAAPTEKAVLDIMTTAANSSTPVVTLLDTKTQEAIKAKLPTTVQANTLKIDECFTLAATATTVSGAKTLTVTSTVKYDAKANVVVLAYVNGEWVVLDTEIVDGELVVTLPEDVVAQMATGAEVTTMILSDAE